jgi:hypothetical protein
MLVEWEAALAADHPFRKAADALLFYSHGATDVEDTTIQRHAVAVGELVSQEWMYWSTEDISEILRHRATRDLDTKRPLIYASTDAHASNRFVDETWNAKWKMTNGIRVWCIDKKTGKTIHIGGEFTWGDCMEVRRRFESLAELGVLPLDGDYGNGLIAQVALLTDGLDWVAEYVLTLFPDAVYVLDPYHVLEHVSDAAHKAFPKEPKKARAIIQRAKTALGQRVRRPRQLVRKGTRKKNQRRRRSGFDGSGQRLLDDVLLPLLSAAKHGKKRITQAIAYVERNVYRLDYGNVRTRGIQLGSWAMESFHRTASQVRLKRAGCHWTAEVAQAILNLRLLTLAGRWDAFWGTHPLMQLDCAGGSA